LGENIKPQSDEVGFY